MSRRRVIALIGVLCGAGTLAVFYPRPARTPAGEPVAAASSSPVAPGQLVVPSSSPTQRLATLDNSLRAVADGERAAPRDRWEPAYVAERLGRDPARVLEWVRESTCWVPYRGAL